MIRSVYNIELHIAKERDKLAIHFKKWKKVGSCLKQPAEPCYSLHSVGLLIIFILSSVLRVSFFVSIVISFFLSYN